MVMTQAEINQQWRDLQAAEGWRVPEREPGEHHACEHCPDPERAGWRRVAYINDEGTMLCYRHIVNRPEVNGG